MRPGEFVYNTVRDEAVKKGAELRIAEGEAEQAFHSYKNNTFKKTVSAMMESHIAEAVKKTKKRAESIL